MKLNSSTLLIYRPDNPWHFHAKYMSWLLAHDGYPWNSQLIQCFLDQHLSSHGKWTVRDSELALGDPCRHVFPKKSRGSLRHCNAMPASNAYDSMSWKYISMASWMGIFLARKSLGDLVYHIWWKHRPRREFTKLCLSLGETQKFETLNTKMWPNCFQNWCLDFESYLYNVYVM